MCSFIEAICCDLLGMFHLNLLVDSCFFRGALFFGVCGVLFSVLSRSLFSFFRRRSLDESVLQS
jgi:hypothetical protein